MKKLLIIPVCGLLFPLLIATDVIAQLCFVVVTICAHGIAIKYNQEPTLNIISYRSKHINTEMQYLLLYKNSGGNFPRNSVCLKNSKY